MGKYESHYPEFDVMEQKEYWDDHSREIVEKRLLKEAATYQSLTEREANTLFQFCSILLDEQREEILRYILRHFDQKLSSDIGEGQRKKNIPPAPILIKGGLAELFEWGEPIEKKQVERMINDSHVFSCQEFSVPIKDFMSKMLLVTTAAYYSHPVVWSEIGYAGPAYPRGYVRTEWGLTDPWEARR